MIKINDVSFKHSRFLDVPPEVIVQLSGKPFDLKDYIERYERDFGRPYPMDENGWIDRGQAVELARAIDITWSFSFEEFWRNLYPLVIRSIDITITTDDLS